MEKMRGKENLFGDLRVRLAAAAMALLAACGDGPKFDEDLYEARIAEVQRLCSDVNKSAFACVLYDERFGHEIVGFSYECDYVRLNGFPVQGDLREDLGNPEHEFMECEVYGADF